MSSESSSNTSKKIASGQKKNQKPSSFRFNVNAESFDPSKRGSSSNPANFDGNHGEDQIQESTNSIAHPAISTSTGMQAQHRYTHNQPQNTSFGYAPTAYLMPQYQLRPRSGFQPAGPMVHPPAPLPAMYVQPSGSVYQQPMMNQSYSGPNPSMNMSLPPQRPISGPRPGPAQYNGSGTHQQPMMNLSYSGPNPSMNMSLPLQRPISGPPPGSAPYNGSGTHQQSMMNQSYSGPNPSMSRPPQLQQPNYGPVVPIMIMNAPQHQQQPMMNQLYSGPNPPMNMSLPLQRPISGPPPGSAPYNGYGTHQQPMMNQSYSGPNPPMNMSLPLQRPISGPPPGSAPYNGYGTHQQPMMNQSYSGPNPSMNMSLPLQRPQGQARPETRDPTVGRPSQNRKLQGRQLSKKQAGPGSSNRSRSNPQTNGAPSTQTVTEEVSNTSKEQENETLRGELERLRKQYGAVESWARSENIDLDSVLADHEAVASSNKVKDTNFGHGDTVTDEDVVKPDAISEKNSSEPPETSKTVPISIPKLNSTEKAGKTVESVGKTAEAKHPKNQELDEILKADSVKVRVEPESPIGLEKSTGAKTLPSTSEVHSPAVEPISYSDVVRTGLQEISSVQQSSKKTVITPTKAPETIVVKDKENVPPLEKKVPDYSNWVNRDEVHKKWAAENAPAVKITDEFKAENSPTETPILQQQQAKGKKVFKLEQTTSQLTDGNLTTDVHVVQETSVEPVEKSPKGVKNTPKCETPSGNSSMPRPSENTEIVYESEEVKEENEFKAQLRTQKIADQCDNIEKWLFAKAKKELIEKKRDASTNSDLLDEESLKDLVTEYVDLLYEYSDVMYLNRACYLAFDSKRPHVHQFQELMITHWRHNPLYAHRAKRDAAKIDTIVRGRMEHYKNLGTLDGQQMFCFLAALMMLDRECLTADLLFLYGSSKSDSCLSEHEKKYFDMVLSFKEWEPTGYRSKPAYQEDLERLSVKLNPSDMNNFLVLLDNQCYLRIQQGEQAQEMDRVQSLVYDAYMDSRVKDIDWCPKKTKKFLDSRLTKLKKIEEPSAEINQQKKYYEFLKKVSSSILDFDAYWFKQCLDPHNTETWHCLKSDADFFKYLFNTER